MNDSKAVSRSEDSCPQRTFRSPCQRQNGMVPASSWGSQSAQVGWDLKAYSTPQQLILVTLHANRWLCVFCLHPVKIVQTLQTESRYGEEVSIKVSILLCLCTTVCHSLATCKRIFSSGKKPTEIPRSKIELISQMCLRH